MLVSSTPLLRGKFPVQNLRTKRALPSVGEQVWYSQEVDVEGATAVQVEVVILSGALAFHLEVSNDLHNWRDAGNIMTATSEDTQCRHVSKQEVEVDGVPHRYARLRAYVTRGKSEPASFRTSVLKV